MESPRPYRQFVPGEPVNAEGFNGLQSAALHELALHTHAALPADALHPEARLQVAALSASSVNIAGRDLMAVAAERVSTAGGRVGGDLRVQGDLQVAELEGHVGESAQVRLITLLIANAFASYGQYSGYDVNNYVVRWGVLTASSNTLQPFFTYSLRCPVPSRLTFSLLGQFRPLRIEIEPKQGQKISIGSDLVPVGPGVANGSNILYASYDTQGAALESAEVPAGEHLVSFYSYQNGYPGAMMQLLVVPLPGGGGA